MSSALVEIVELSRVFRQGAVEIKALTNINLRINGGEFVALMGPSGSGKTTLLNIIAGIEKPTAGSVRVAGKDIPHMSENELAEWRNRNLGFVFQKFNLIPVLTAAENVGLPLLLTRLSKTERRDHVMTALNLVGLADRADHYPKQLSGGEEQRVAIARSIVTDPAIILADEPTGNLDAKSADDILTLLRRLNTEMRKTIILVTHDEGTARYVDGVRRLNKGVLLTQDVMLTGERI
jgi:putative ABC transport system ATP-binding protein